MTATFYLQKTLYVTDNHYGFAGVDIQFNLDTAMTKVIERIDRVYGGQIDRSRGKTNQKNFSATTIIVDLK